MQKVTYQSLKGRPKAHVIYFLSFFPSLPTRTCVNPNRPLQYPNKSHLYIFVLSQLNNIMLHLAVPRVKIIHKTNKIISEAQKWFAFLISGLLLIMLLFLTLATKKTNVQQKQKLYGTWQNREWRCTRRICSAKHTRTAKKTERDGRKDQTPEHPMIKGEAHLVFFGWISFSSLSFSFSFPQI